MLRTQMDKHRKDWEYVEWHSDMWCIFMMKQNKKIFVVEWVYTMIILHILISLKIKIQAACNLHQAVRATFSASKKNCDISKIVTNICC